MLLNSQHFIAYYKAQSGDSSRESSTSDVMEAEIIRSFFYIASHPDVPAFDLSLSSGCFFVEFEISVIWVTFVSFLTCIFANIKLCIINKIQKV